MLGKKDGIIKVRELCTHNVMLIILWILSFRDSIRACPTPESANTLRGETTPPASRYPVLLGADSRIRDERGILFRVVLF